jgi:hypothetical protein
VKGDGVSGGSGVQHCRAHLAPPNNQPTNPPGKDQVREACGRQVSLVAHQQPLCQARLWLRVTFGGNGDGDEAGHGVIRASSAPLPRVLTPVLHWGVLVYTHSQDAPQHTQTCLASNWLLAN